MNQITRILIGLLGLTVIGIVTYYVVSKDGGKSKTIEKTITNPEQDSILTAKVIDDSLLVRISNVIGLNGEEFKATEVKGVYSNITNDKLLVINEDIWKKLINKAIIKFPNTAWDCRAVYSVPELASYKFIGLLTYFTDDEKNKKSTAYAATEINGGNAISFAGGEICCDCEGDGGALVPQQVDAVVVN